MSDLQSEVRELRERVAQLERRQLRPRRSTNQKGACEYLGRSREWLRQRLRAGIGPRQNPDGSFDYAALDEFLDTA
jgi:hypothetical protein